jgi:hypothetical protein
MARFFSVGREAMHTKRMLFIALSSVLLHMCTFYDLNGAVTSSNGLSCQSQTNVGSFERQGEKNRFYIVRRVAQCSYQCPDGKFRQFEFPGKFSTSSPLYSASQEEVILQVCGMAFQPTLTPSPATVSPTLAGFPTASSTEQTSSPPSADASATVKSPLLRGNVTMCDLAANLINFRMIEPAADLAGKALDVQIADQESMCAVNPVNLSLLTCTIPASVTFPASIVVRLDGAVVNDFIFDGRGCAKISTPFPTTSSP